MAFWKKKSEDPWDIDPEQRRREAAAFYEAETESAEPAEPEERGGFLTGLFGKKEPEEEVPVPCPYCGAEMEKGYLVGGKGLIEWTKVKPGAILGSFFAEAITIGDEGFLSSYKTCHLCAACRKLVVDIPEEEVLSEPAKPPGEAADEAYERYKEQLKDYQ